jgi:hypothetical protein
MKKFTCPALGLWHVLSPRDMDDVLKALVRLCIREHGY